MDATDEGRRRCPRGHAIDWLTPELGVCECPELQPGLVCTTWTWDGRHLARSGEPVVRLLAVRLLNVRYFLEQDVDAAQASEFLTIPLAAVERISPAALAAARAVELDE